MLLKMGEVHGDAGRVASERPSSPALHPSTSEHCGVILCGYYSTSYLTLALWFSMWPILMKILCACVFCHDCMGCSLNAN